MARIVTTVVGDAYVKLTSNVLEGICIDIWKRVAMDLGINYSIEIAEKWTDMFEILRDNRADVIVQTIDMGMMREQGCGR